MEVINAFFQEKIFELTTFFRARFMGQADVPSSWRIVKLVFLRKPDAEPNVGIRSWRKIALPSVMSRWSCTLEEWRVSVASISM